MLHTIRYRLTLFLAIAAIFFIGLCYVQGVRKNLDTRITFAFEHDAWSMSIALSRLLFDLHEGYVGYREVVRVTSLALVPNALHDTSSIPFLQNPASIQEALDQAQAIDPKNLPEYTPDLGGNFVTIAAEDVGLADFYTMAFVIFGYHPTAMYDFYFLVFACSALLFIMEYRKQTAPLVTLLLSCATFSVFFFSRMFEQSGMPSVNANRFATSLCVIPIMHALWSLHIKDKLSSSRIVLLIAQALIFSFAVSIRKTGQLQLPLLLVAMAVIAWRIWWPQTRHFSLTTLRILVKYPPIASGLIFIGIYTSYGLIQTTQLNKIYFSECAIPQHMTWHSMFLGLSIHPDWNVYNTMSTPGAKGDAIAWSAFEKYMNNRNEKYDCNETGGLHKLRVHEKVIRELYLEFAAAHPKYMLELHAYYKPLKFIKYMKDIIKGVDRVFWYIILSLSIIAGIYSAFLAATPPSMYRHILAFACMALMITLLPPLLAYPNPVMSDILWMLVINFCLWSWAIAYRLTTICLSLLRLGDRQDNSAYQAVLSHNEEPADKKVNASFGRKNTLFALGLMALGFSVGRASVAVPTDDRIHVYSATYGKSCGAKEGNATRFLSIACNGQYECNYKIDVGVLGDPSSGCSKDFEVLWTCGINKEQNKLYIPGEAGLGKMSLLMCPPLL